MATLIEVTTPQGTTRRCDAACHNGHGERCECICGGKFHGKGEKVHDTPWEELNAVRARLALGEHAHVQLRIGA